MIPVLTILYQAFSLPPLFQYGVAIANVISAGAVIIYIIQLRVTKKQFRLQMELSRTELDLTKNQFILVNQGYLDVQPQVLYLNDFLQELTRTEIKINNQTPVRYLSPILKLTNMANVPITIDLITFKMLVQNTETYDRDLIKGKDKVYFIYPKQSINIAGEIFGTKGQNILTLKEWKLDMQFEISYSTELSSRIKSISRKYSFDLHPYGNNFYQEYQKDVF